jgi:VWFA-related protein
VTNGSPKSYEAPLRATARRLASQGIAVYPVDVRGLTTASLPTGGRGPGNATAPQIGSGLNQFAAMELFAEVTGGRVVKYSNDPGRGLTLAAIDQRGAYSLAFHADAPDGQWHHLKVAVSRPGIRLSCQQGYLARLTHRTRMSGRRTSGVSPLTIRLAPLRSGSTRSAR